MTVHQIHGRRAAIAAMMGFTGIPATALATPVRSRTAAGRVDPTVLRGSVGEIILASDSRMTALARPQNLLYAHVRPLAVARCSEPRHVAAAIAWARDSRVPFVLRSGGHSYAGCSTTEGLLIDLRGMSEVRMDSDGLVRVGGGALNADLYAALRTRDLRVTHGRCLGVGASAFLMGGGIGFGMRDLGLGCDAVRAVTLMRADGTLMTASATENPDVFRAMRGAGGGNLGVAVEWVLEPVRSDRLTGLDFTWDSGGERLFAELVRALEAAPDRLGTKVSVTAAHQGMRTQPKVRLIGQLRGDPNELADLLAPAMRVAPPAVRRVRETDYWAVQDVLSEAGLPARYRETSNYTHNLPEGVSQEVFRRLRERPAGHAELNFKMFHVGGRIRHAPAGGSAFVHRGAEWLTGTEVVLDRRDSVRRDEEVFAWQRAFHHAVVAITGPGGSYQNFPDPGLENPATSYYGADLDFLRGVRRAMDPEGAFTPPRRQGITG